MATRAPWLASARAVAAPMPWLAPVISTTFPVNPGSIIRCTAARRLAATRHRRDRFDLDQEAVMQLFRRHNRPRRSMLAEMAGVDRVDAPPQAHVGDVDGGLEHVRQIAAGGLQDRGDVAQRLLGLLLDGTEAFLAGRRVDGELSRDVDDAVVHDGLRIMPGRLRRVGRRDRVHAAPFAAAAHRSAARNASSMICFFSSGTPMAWPSP